MACYKLQKSLSLPLCDDTRTCRFDALDQQLSAHAHCNKLLAVPRPRPQERKRGWGADPAPAEEVGRTRSRE